MTLDQLVTALSHNSSKSHQRVPKQLIRTIQSFDTEKNKKKTKINQKSTKKV